MDIERPEPALAERGISMQCIGLDFARPVLGLQAQEDKTVVSFSVSSLRTPASVERPATELQTCTSHLFI
jgi:hypothetical protein